MCACQKSYVYINNNDFQNLGRSQMYAGACYVFRTSKPHSGTLCILFYMSRPSSRSSVRSDRSDRPSSRAGQRSKQPVLGVGTLAYQPQLFDEDPGGYLV